ncbi:hypothetical protein [Legionella fallonii]|nr:hypothetical protein [Legionella fallonii]
MNKKMVIKITRGICSLSVYGIYHLFIGLILAFIFSQNPHEFLHELNGSSWPFYLAVAGVVIGIYLSLSSCLSFCEGTASHQYRIIDWNKVYFYIEILVHMTWILLPTLLIQYAESLRALNHSLIIFGVVFFLSFAMRRRNRLHILGGLL